MLYPYQQCIPHPLPQLQPGFVWCLPDRTGASHAVLRPDAVMMMETLGQGLNGLPEPMYVHAPMACCRASTATRGLTMDKFGTAICSAAGRIRADEWRRRRGERKGTVTRSCMGRVVKDT